MGFLTEFFFLHDCSRICSLSLVDSVSQNPQSRHRNAVQSFSLLFGVPGIDMRTWEGAEKMTEP